MSDSKTSGKLHESCDDCDWEAYWDGGTAAEDPAIDHARETGHTVTGRVAGMADNDSTDSEHDEELRTDGGDDVCPECGDPVSGLVIAGPGDVTAQPCGHAARSLLQERMDTVRPDGGDHVG